MDGEIQQVSKDLSYFAALQSARVRGLGFSHMHLATGNPLPHIKNNGSTAHVQNERRIAEFAANHFYALLVICSDLDC